MKFGIWVDDNRTYITAEFEINDKEIGNREEGPGTEIKLNHRIVSFDYVVKKIHPDVLALICLTIFFPFIGDTVTFPESVSPRLVKSLKRTPFTKKKDITITNIDEELEMPGGKNIALAFGGGIDSSAVRVMFPEAYIIHEGHVRNGIKENSECVRFINSIGEEKGRVIFTNSRYMSTPGGWHSWPASMSTSLLMTGDLDIGLILCGTVMGSNYLWNGAKFYDRHENIPEQGESGNYWASIFYDIGVPLFSPIDGISEFGSMKTAVSLIEKGEVTYCMLTPKGNACSKCTKCFRREILRACIDKNYTPEWKNYQTPIIEKFLSKRPLYFGHIFSYANKLEIIPEIFSKNIIDIQKISTDWPIKYYLPALDFVKPEWSELIKERVLKHFELMDDKEMIELKNWNQNLHNKIENN